MNFFTVYNELHEPTEHKMRKISFLYDHVYFAFTC